VPPIRVLIADDHSLVRAGLRALLSAMPGIEVAGETGDGRNAVALARELKPKVVLMDISMQGLNGIDATERITNEDPRCRVIVLSMHSNREYVARAFQVGAAGYLIKDATQTELEIAVRAAARGEKYVSPGVAMPIIDGYTALASHGPEGEELTLRQREIMQLIAEGLTTKEIASALNLGVKTIETYRTQLMERLDIHRVADLVRYAIRIGLISPDK